MSMVLRNGTGCTTDQRERHARPPTRAADPDPPGSPTRGPVPSALLRRVALLSTRDRAIVELTLRSRLSRAHIARALGLSAGQVSRRLRVLYARLHDPLVVALCDDRCPLPTELRQLGIEHHLLALPARQLADKHRMPVTEVRRLLVFLHGWQKGRTAR